MRLLTIFIFSFTFLCTSLCTSYVHARKPHLSPIQETQFKNLADNLRCVVCNNQSIYESDSPIANNIRNLIRTRLGQGDNPVLIKDYLHERYGDVILLTPPLNRSTLAFWFIVSIILLLLFSVIALVFHMNISNPKDSTTNAHIHSQPLKSLSNKKIILILTPMILLSCVVFAILLINLDGYNSYKSIDSFNININKIDNDSHLTKDFCENPSMELTTILMGQQEKIRSLTKKCSRDYPNSIYIQNLRKTLHM